MYSTGFHRPSAPFPQLNIPIFPLPSILSSDPARLTSPTPFPQFSAPVSPLPSTLSSDPVRRPGHLRFFPISVPSPSPCRCISATHLAVPSPRSGPGRPRSASLPSEGAASRSRRVERRGAASAGAQLSGAMCCPLVTLLVLVCAVGAGAQNSDPTAYAVVQDGSDLNLPAGAAGRYDTVVSTHNEP